MLHISELKVLLDNQNLDEFSKKVKEHFQGSNQDDVTSANKVINLISVHIYYKKCTVQVLKILSPLFTEAIECLSRHQNLIDKAQIDKAYQSISYVLDKGIYPAEDVDMVLNFNFQIEGFLKTFKANFCSSKNHDVFFQKSLQLAHKQKSSTDISKIVKSALTTYVFGAEVKKGQDGPKNFSAKISIVKSLYRAKLKEMSTSQLAEIVYSAIKTIDQFYQSGEILWNNHIEVLSLKIFLMEIEHKEIVGAKNIIESSLKKIENDFQESYELIEKVPKESYHYYAKFFEGLFQLSLQSASKLYNRQLGLMTITKLLKKSLSSALMLKEVCPEIMSNFRLETSCSVLVYALTDLKEVEQGMLEVARAISLYCPSESFYNLVKSYTSVKIRALKAGHASKNSFLHEIISKNWPEIPQVKLIKVAKLEILCSRNYGELLGDRKRIAKWIHSVAEPYSVDSANVLIEECLISFFENDVSSDISARAKKAIQMLNECHRPESGVFSFFKAVAFLSCFLVSWKRSTLKLNSDLESHKQEITKKPQSSSDEQQDEIEMSDIRPYEKAINWDQEDSLIEYLIQSLRHLKSLPSEEEISSEGWIAHPQTIVNVASLLSQIFYLVGTESEYGESLLFYLEVSDKFSCINDKCAAALDLSKAFGIQESTKEANLKALKSDALAWSVGNPKLSHLKIILGCAWCLYHRGEFSQALKICGQILTESGINFNNDSLITTLGEIYYLAALCRQTGTSFQISVNHDSLPDWCGGHADFAIYGPLELCSISLTKFHEAGLVNQTKPGHDFLAIASSCRMMSCSIEASKLMSELVTRIGMPLEMKSRSVIFQDYCDKSACALRIVEGLLTVAEINFIFDKPDACQIKLLEAEKILDEVICDKTKSNDSKKVTWIVQGTEDIGASPLLVRRKANLPRWITKHEVGCLCRLCNNPNLQRIVVKFFTLQAISLYSLSDIDGGMEIFSKLETVILKILKKCPGMHQWGIYSRDHLIQTCFESFRWRIEVLGRSGQFQECLSVITLLEKVLKAAGRSSRKKFPFLDARLLELKLSIQHDLDNQSYFQNFKEYLSPSLHKSFLNQLPLCTPANPKVIKSRMPRKPSKKIVIPGAALAEVKNISTFTVGEK